MCALYKLQGESGGQRFFFVLGPLVWEQSLDLVSQLGSARVKDLRWYLKLSGKVRNSRECVVFHRMQIRCRDSNSLLSSHLL